MLISGLPENIVVFAILLVILYFGVKKLVHDSVEGGNSKKNKSSSHSNTNKNNNKKSKTSQAKRNSTLKKSKKSTRPRNVSSGSGGSHGTGNPQPNGSRQQSSSLSPNSTSGTRPRNTSQSGSVGSNSSASAQQSSNTQAQNGHRSSRGSDTNHRNRSKDGPHAAGTSGEFSTQVNKTDFHGVQVRTSSGEQVSLNKEIGAGKEGTVYSDESYAFKIYNPDKRGDDRLEQKIRIMIENPLGEQTTDSHQWFGWPKELVFYRDIFVGYKMPLINMAEFENIRTHVRSELSGHPPVSEARIKLARNLTTIVSLVHKQGHAIGDFNYENILVKDSRITMIDCDAYSINSDSGQDFHGSTIFDRTVPPEGRPEDSMQQAQLADNFNLAKWLFRILTDNRNPYQAKGELAATGSLLDMMQKNPFPYWNVKDNLIEPTAGGAEYDDFPPEIKLLFESVFLGGKFHPYKRPSPEVWKKILERRYRSKTDNTVPARERIEIDETAIKGTQSGNPSDFRGIRNSEDISSIESIGKQKTVVGAVTSVRPLREYSQGGERTFVSNAIISDKTGKIGLSFSGKQGVVAARSFHPGLTLEVTGTVDSSYHKRTFDYKIDVDKYEVRPCADNYNKAIEDLEPNSFDANVRGKIIGVSPIRQPNHGKVQKLLTLVLADHSGYCHVTLRNSMADRLKLVPLGLTLEVVDGRVKPHSQDIIISESNNMGSLVPPVLTDLIVADDDVTSSLDTDSISHATRGDDIDLQGTVTGVDHSSRKSNHKFTISDGTGKILIQLETEFAEYDIERGDELLLTSIKIRDSASKLKNGTTTQNSVLTIIS